LNGDMTSDLMTEQEAGGYIGKPPRTLAQWRYLKKGPAYIKVGDKSVRYRQADLDAFLDAHRIDPAVLVGGPPGAA